LITHQLSKINHRDTEDTKQNFELPVQFYGSY
jgi:hypothetical protein